MQPFIQTLSTVAVFGIMIEFMGKGNHPHHKHYCSWGSRVGMAGSWAEPHKFCYLLHLVIADAIWPVLRGQILHEINSLLIIKKFCLFWVTHLQLSSNATEIKSTLFEDFETSLTTNHWSLHKWKELKRTFFQGILVFFQCQVLFTGNLKGTSLSFQNQTTQIRQPWDFIVMQFFPNEKKQQQTSLV